MQLSIISVSNHLSYQIQLPVGTQPENGTKDESLIISTQIYSISHPGDLTIFASLQSKNIDTIWFIFVIETGTICCQHSDDNCEHQQLLVASNEYLIFIQYPFTSLQVLCGYTCGDYIEVNTNEQALYPFYIHKPQSVAFDACNHDSEYQLIMVLYNDGSNRYYKFDDWSECECWEYFDI